MIGDSDDYPRRYRIAGPSVGRVSIDRADRRIAFDFSLPTGRAIMLTDEGDNVRCEVTDERPEAALA